MARSDPSRGDTERSDNHEERLKDADHEVRWLGVLEGMAVGESDTDGPILFLHGDKRSCAVNVGDEAFASGLARAGVEIEAVLEDSDTDRTDK